MPAQRVVEAPRVVGHERHVARVARLGDRAHVGCRPVVAGREDRDRLGVGVLVERARVTVSTVGTCATSSSASAIVTVGSLGAHEPPGRCAGQLERRPDTLGRQTPPTAGEVPEEREDPHVDAAELPDRDVDRKLFDLPEQALVEDRDDRGLDHRQALANSQKTRQCRATEQPVASQRLR